MLKGRDSGCGYYRDLLLHPSRGCCPWHRGYGNTRPVFGLPATPRFNVVLSIDRFRPVATVRNTQVAMQECCEFPKKRDGVVCPKNGKICKPVSRITVEALIRPEFRASLISMPYYFCESPDCDIVYVAASEQRIIAKNQLRVRVGVKEREDPIPLCYCFGFDKKAIRDDICMIGATDIPEKITCRVKAGECRCEITNPSGNCCLGNIYRAVEGARNTKSVKHKTAD